MIIFHRDKFLRNKEDYTKEPDYDPTAEPYEFGSEEYFKVLNSLKEKRDEYRQQKIKEKQFLDKYLCKYVKLDER